jgi:hypothetical protein
MAPLRQGLTSVRRAVGVTAVLFLLSCAVAFYLVGSGFPMSGLRARTADNSYASPLPASLDTQSPTPGGPSSSAGSSPSSRPTASTATTTPRAGDSSGRGSSGERTIQVENSAGSAKPFQIVRIRGRYYGGAGTFLRVQRWEGGIWLDFPIPTKTDESGRFTAHVEVGQRGRYTLRVLDPDSGVASEPFELVVAG